MRRGTREVLQGGREQDPMEGVLFSPACPHFRSRSAEGPFQGSPGSLLWGGGDVPILSFQDCVLTMPPWPSILGLTLGFLVLRLAVWEGQAAEAALL